MSVLARRVVSLVRSHAWTAAATWRWGTSAEVAVPVAAGRRRRRASKSAPTASVESSSVQPLTLPARPPPSLQRLPLSNCDLKEVLELGCAQGPEAAYVQLVQKRTLQPDEAQHRCAEALQDLWEALRAHEEAKESWQEEFTLWKKHHKQWKVDYERWLLEAGTADSKAASSSIGHKLEPIEPMEPAAPALASHGVYIWGGVGAGKSLLMDLFVESCGPQSGIEQPVKRVHFHEFMHRVHRELHRLRQAGSDKTTRTVAQDIARETKLLAFDEFQITNISDALIVETLFTGLFQEGVRVIMTSNRPPHDLYKDGLNRHLAIPQLLALLGRRGVHIHELVAARDFRTVPGLSLEVPSLSMHMGMQPLRWRDFYCKGVTRTQESTGSPCVHAEVFLSEAFASAAPLDTPRSGPSRVAIAWGRTLEIVESAGKVGRFTFGQLCEQALNADDYLILAQKFHTLIVADVPRLSLEQHNEARRFTNLIDCAYEHHARLVISAEAPPDQVLSSMEVLAGLTLKFEEGAPARPESAASTVTEAVRQASAGANDAAPGNDEQTTGSGVAGVMAGALGSLQESGFAARRATSRLLHMQTVEYLVVHQQYRLCVE